MKDFDIQSYLTQGVERIAAGALRTVVRDPREVTDARRGTGVFDRLMENMEQLRERGILFGCSVTVTADHGEPFRKRRKRRRRIIRQPDSYPPDFFVKILSEIVL